MSETWKRWEGQVVNGALPLLRYLGGSDHSAVFLTERVGGAPQKAVIKIIPARADKAEDQLLRWKQAARIAHPGLLRLFESGRCELEGTRLLYVVMEYAEENLSQIVPERPLTPAEAQQMLPPVLKALSYLHGNGLVHGHVKPSNIMAAGDQVKVSSDTLRTAGEMVGRKGDLGVYDPPEATKGKLASTTDIWALGITLVEVLTQRPPVWNRAQAAPPALPEGIPEPFREIVRRCLQVDPQQRWKVAEIAARLQLAEATPPKAVAPTTMPGEGKGKSVKYRDCSYCPDSERGPERTNPFFPIAADRGSASGRRAAERRFSGALSAPSKNEAESCDTCEDAVRGRDWRTAASRHGAKGSGPATGIAARVAQRAQHD